MELTRIMMSLERVREAQMEAQSALQRQGALLHDLVLLNRETVKIQQQTVRMLTSISKAKESLPQDKSPRSSPLIASDAIQWVVAAGLVAFVLRGGDPGALLKMLGL
jgi:hypothetical protein